MSTSFPMLTFAEKLDEIRRLYFRTTKQTILRDFARAVDLVTSMTTEEERERVAVYLEGLAQMRSDWVGTNRQPRKRRETAAKDKGPHR